MSVDEVREDDGRDALPGPAGDQPPAEADNTPDPALEAPQDA